MLPEVEAFKRMAQRMYADVVAEELQANEGGYKNPLIVAVKDYIFQHFHESIQITDIAKYLKVNPDYLSHFSRSRNILPQTLYFAGKNPPKPESVTVFGLQYSGNQFLSGLQLSEPFL